MRNLRNRLEQLWCEHMHASTMWPIHGKYRCGTCLREYPVEFERQSDPRSSVFISGQYSFGAANQR